MDRPCLGVRHGGGRRSHSLGAREAICPLIPSQTFVGCLLGAGVGPGADGDRACPRPVAPSAHVADDLCHVLGSAGCRDQERQGMPLPVFLCARGGARLGRTSWRKCPLSWCGYE